jgi:hypothetical protein
MRIRSRLVGFRSKPLGNRRFSTESERAGLSKHVHVAKAMDYMLTRWSDFTGFLADGRICLTNYAAERSLRGVALGRKA